MLVVLSADLGPGVVQGANPGPGRWAAHHGVVRRELNRFRGWEMETAGDGFFATFGGPARGV